MKLKLKLKLKELSEFWEKMTWREFLRGVWLVFLGANAVGLSINITLTILSYGR